MAALRVTLEPSTKERVAPGDVAVEATVVNGGGEPVLFNEAQAQHGPLVLQVEDERGERLLLPPPSAPDEHDLGPGKPLKPGDSVTLRYAGFLDARLESGRYRVRYHSSHPPLGGSPADPLASEWVAIDVVRPELPKPRRPRLLFGFLDDIWQAIRRLIDWIIELILWWRRCRRVLTQEVDRYVTETISDAPAGAEAWNGTYAWHARFQVGVEEASCRVVVTIRIRLNGTITAAQQSAWESSIEAAWGNRFKCCADLRCCPNGLPIVLDIQFVASGEHQVVNVQSSTTNMGNWGASDTTDVRHEVGHMLGNKEEYFTVDGVAYGAARQATGNIMNNPANDPVAAHYSLVRDTVNGLLGESGTVKAVADTC